MERRGFRTARCEVGPAAPCELAALRAIACTPAVARMLLLFHPGMGEAEFAAIHPPGRTEPPMRWAIRRGGAVIGSIGCGAGPVAPVFYFLDPAAAGQGIASEVLPAFCDHVLGAFRQLEALSAEVFSDNPASARVLERAGFTCGGPVMLRSAGRAAPAPGTAWNRGRR